MDNSKFLTSKEYNTIAVKFLTDVMYKYNKEEYDLLLDKLFTITVSDHNIVNILSIN